MCPWSVATVFDEKSDRMPRPWHSISYVVWRRKNDPVRFTGCDTLRLCQQIVDLLASLPAGAESPCRLPSLGAVCRELEKAKTVPGSRGLSFRTSSLSPPRPASLEDGYPCQGLPDSSNSLVPSAESSGQG